MNLAEGLRIYGVDVQRPYEWMAKYSAALSAKVRALPDIKDWRTPAKEMVAQARAGGDAKYTDALLRWATRDGVHNAIYLRAQSIDNWLEVADTVVI